MPKEYGAVGSEVTPYALSTEQLTAIGRLLRACAEIEDIVSVYLCDLASISDGHMVLMLGRAGLSAKLQIARRFAAARGPDDLQQYIECFETDDLGDVILCRNVVAHGTLLGQIVGGKIAFRTAQISELAEQRFCVETICYDPPDFELFANKAEKICEQLDVTLQIRDLRAARNARPLDPHIKATPKGQTKRERSSVETQGE